METTNKKNLLNRNIFNKLNSIKGTRVNNNYRRIVNKLAKFSNNISQFIDYVENSIENDMNATKRITQRNLLSFINAKKNKTGNNSQRIKSNRSAKFNSINKRNKFDLSLEIPKKKVIKAILDNQESKNSILEENKSNIFLKKYHQKSYTLLRKGPNQLSNSVILNNKRNLNNFFKTRNISVSNSTTNRFNPNNYYIYNKNKKNQKNFKKPQSATSTISINNYNYKKNKSKTQNLSKNLSISLYRSNKNYFSNYKNILKPELLTKFVKKAKKIQNSYKKDLVMNLTNKNKKLLKIAEEELNMNVPELHHRELFKNDLQVKKTVRNVRKMRAENKTKVKYFGPGNINNESIIRTKNANLIRFCDSICHMKDDKFYMYRKVLKELYPNLIKGAMKQKYQISEKDDIYRMKCKENKLKIDRLFAVLQK